ncbi:hypothetical protein C8R45DRAFT_1157106 [Mycena sanguinolenta]|nr:hypothetical protein C8R45DRAFT_1157106 [Mycena sanguinolenta]
MRLALIKSRTTGGCVQQSGWALFNGTSQQRAPNPCSTRHKTSDLRRILLDFYVIYGSISTTLVAVPPSSSPVRHCHAHRSNCRSSTAGLAELLRLLFVCAWAPARPRRARPRFGRVCDLTSTSCRGEDSGPSTTPTDLPLRVHACVCAGSSSYRAESAISTIHASVGGPVVFALRPRRAIRAVGKLKILLVPARSSRSSLESSTLQASRTNAVSARAPEDSETIQASSSPSLSGRASSSTLVSLCRSHGPILICFAVLRRSPSPRLVAALHERHPRDLKHPKSGVYCARARVKDVLQFPPGDCPCAFPIPRCHFLFGVHADERLPRCHPSSPLVPIHDLALLHAFLLYTYSDPAPREASSRGTTVRARAGHILPFSPTARENPTLFFRHRPASPIYPRSHPELVLMRDCVEVRAVAPAAVCALGRGQRPGARPPPPFVRTRASLDDGSFGLTLKIAYSLAQRSPTSPQIRFAAAAVLFDVLWSARRWPALTMRCCMYALWTDNVLLLALYNVLHLLVDGPILHVHGHIPPRRDYFALIRIRTERLKLFDLPTRMSLL